MNLNLIYAFIVGGIFLIGAAFGWQQKSIRVPALLEEQRIADQEACNKDKEKTRQANEQLQKDRDSIAQRAATYKRLYAMRCVVPSRQPDIQQAGGEHAKKDGRGIRAEWLLDFASECEIYRSELKTCISFIAAERAL